MFVPSRFLPGAAGVLVLTSAILIAAGDEIQARENPPARLGIASAAPTADAVGRIRLQMALAMDGAYRGPLDGAMGPATERAIRHIQHRVGLPVTGVLSEAERTRLERRLQGLLGLLEFGLVEDRASGALIPMPMTMTETSRRVEGGRLYGEDAGMLHIFSADMRGDPEDFADLRGRMAAAMLEARSEAPGSDAHGFSISGSLASAHGPKSVWARYVYREGIIRGLSYSYRSGERHSELMHLLTYFAEQLYVPFPARDPLRTERVRALLPAGGVR